MFNQTKQSVNVGLVGLGTVGTGVAKILLNESDRIRQKTGVSLALKKVCVRSLSKKRSLALPKQMLTTQAESIYSDPSIDIVVELIGGIDKAKDILIKSFQEGKHVVTANKALLAEQSDAVFNAAGYYRKQLGFEASVCGGIPIIKAIRDGLASNDIDRFLGIVNGTCNYILSKMSLEAKSYGDALKQAQALGFAEANPTLDVEGIDSAHKLAILARLSFGRTISYKSICAEGISKLQAIDIEYAKELGYVIKLLAIAKKHKDSYELRVSPTLIKSDHPLALVRGSYNAVFIHANQAGDQLFYGKGAGQMPTASAVLSDIIDIAKSLTLYGNHAHSGLLENLEKAKIMPMSEIRSQYYLRFQVLDKPGVLGKIAQTLGRFGISILSVQQKESHDPKSTPVLILTYEACEENVLKALKVIDASNFVAQKTVKLRMEK